MPANGQMQLRDILTLVRAQTGKSLNVALGVAERDALIVLIQTKQLELYYDYDWPALLTNADTPLVAGTRRYAFPSTISFDFVNDVWASEPGGAWAPVGYGIAECEFNQTAEGSQGWPVQRWKADPDTDPAGQMELWPVPSQAGTLRVNGRRALSAMIADADYSTLNGSLIGLHVAADILARNKSEDAKVKMNEAQRLLRNLARRQTANKRDPFVLGGGIPSSWARPLRAGIDYIPS